MILAIGKSTTRRAATMAWLNRPWSGMTKRENGFARDATLSCMRKR